MKKLSNEREMKFKLDDIENRKPFKVPGGYFEDLPLKIQSRVNENTPQSTLWRIPSWSVGLAAAILVVITLIFIVPEGQPNAEELLADISQDELVAYLNEIEIDEYEITNAFDDNAEIFELEDASVLDGIDMGDSALDDVFTEYDLEDEYL